MSLPPAATTSAAPHRRLARATYSCTNTPAAVKSASVPIPTYVSRVSCRVGRWHKQALIQHPQL